MLDYKTKIISTMLITCFFLCLAVSYSNTMSMVKAETLNASGLELEIKNLGKVSISNTEDEEVVADTESEKESVLVVTELGDNDSVFDTLEQESQEIYEECEGTDVDPFLAIAISKLETGNYSSNAFLVNHNFGGMMKNGEIISYSSFEEGLYAYIQCLQYVYYNRGLTTPETIQPIYCPGENDWGHKVNQIIKEIKRNERT